MATRFSTRSIATALVVLLAAVQGCGPEGPDILPPNSYVLGNLPEASAPTTPIPNCPLGTIVTDVHWQGRTGNIRCDGTAWQWGGTCSPEVPCCYLSCGPWPLGECPNGNFAATCDRSIPGATIAHACVL
jgi:predicted small lipoprotein YifL